MGIRDSVSAELIFDGRACRPPTGSARRASSRTVRLGAGRIGIASACVGLSRAALEHAARYATQRTQFGRSIADQEMVQAMLADAATRWRRLACSWRAARLRDAGQPINAASSMAKLYASDTAMRVATDAVQIYGGAGYSRDNPVERFMRDAKEPRSTRERTRSSG